MAIEEPKIMIVGCGPGSPDYVLPAARDAIRDAEVLVGARRFLEMFPSGNAVSIGFSGDGSSMLDEIACYAGKKKIVILVAGDPGLYSLARNVVRRFGRAACRVLPGISSFQVAFARIGLDWEDARLLSLHGRTPSVSPASFADEKKIAVFAGGEQSRRWLCDLGRVLGTRFDVFICSNLTLADERVECITAAELETTPLPSRSIVLFINKECWS